MQEALIKLSSLGDIIHLALLLPMFERRERMWFVDSDFAPLLENAPYISAIYPLPLRRLLRERAYSQAAAILWQLRNIGTFDYAIDAQGLFKSALVGALLCTKHRYGFSRKSAREGIAALFYNHHYHIAYSEHILKRNAQLLAFAYGQTCDEARLAEFLATRASRPLPLAPSAEGAQRIAALLQSFGAKPKILFALESSRASKVYPPRHFLALSKLLPECQILLLSHSAPEVSAKHVGQ
ncbi:MAG: glycosyltransferase family 9 protein, partial [Helicobacter sp.]|nr:glycosyltransferase family 9 protein [Helicobacter sp.]